MKALLVVDIQNDFLPGGALGVQGGDQIVPLVNTLMNQDFDFIVASKDCHPAQHGSFAKTHQKQVGEHIQLNGLEQILWPVHCVQNTQGSEFSSGLNIDQFDQVFQKGTDHEIDSYSAFFDNGHLKATGLGDYLKEKGVTDLYIVGLTTDFCVKFSVLDAIKLGFRTFVIKDACRAVNLLPGDEKKSLEEMASAGATVITTSDLN